MYRLPTALRYGDSVPKGDEQSVETGQRLVEDLHEDEEGQRLLVRRAGSAIGALLAEAAAGRLPVPIDPMHMNAMVSDERSQCLRI